MSPDPTNRLRHVAAVPYPGRGHINPMMNLCRRFHLSNPDLLISFVVTEEWLSLISSDPPPPPTVRLVTIPNCIPSEIGRARDFNGFLHAVYTDMEGPFERVFDGLRPTVDAIVADTYLPWTVAIGNRRSIPVWSLSTMSAAFFSALYHSERIPMPPVEGPEEHVTGSAAAGEADEPLGKYIPGHNSLRLSDLHCVLTSATWKFAAEAFSMVRRAQCVLFTSFYELEPQVIDALREDLQCPVYPVGPSILYMMLVDKPAAAPSGSNIDYIGWLNLQPEQSVLYVSLGSFLSVSGTHMDEIAMGLSLSGVRFVWVARGDSSRLQEMVGGMGIVVPWCDQLKVLSHPSVGGFLTHCGWNSVLEGVFCGLPMLTLPIIWDQPTDNRLIVDEWKVGLSLRGEVGKDGMVGREEIAVVVNKLMDLNGTESKEMRKRAAELRDFARRAIGAGGSSSENLDSLVRGLMQGEDDEDLAYLPRVASPHLPDMLSDMPEHIVLRQFLQLFSWFTTAQSLLLSSSYVLESHVIDILKSDHSVPIYPQVRSRLHDTTSNGWIHNRTTLYSISPWGASCRPQVSKSMRLLWD